MNKGSGSSDNNQTGFKKIIYLFEQYQFKVTSYNTLNE